MDHYVVNVRTGHPEYDLIWQANKYIFKII